MFWVCSFIKFAQNTVVTTTSHLFKLFNLWKLSRLSGVFPPFVGHFFKRAREPEGKLRHVVYEVWLVSYLFFSFQIWYFRKCIITSIGQNKHMRVTHFNPLWVSGITQSFSVIIFFILQKKNTGLLCQMTLLMMLLLQRNRGMWD